MSRPETFGVTLVHVLNYFLITLMCVVSYYRVDMETALNKLVPQVVIKTFVLCNITLSNW